MRIFINVFKLGLWALLWIGIVALTLVVAVVHYEGLSSGFRLLNFENMPLGRDPLFGPYFDAFSPKAGFIEWVSISMTALIMVMSWLVCHFAFAIGRLLPDAHEYHRQGEAARFWRAIGLNAIPVLISVVLLFWLLRGDAAVFQFRALAGQRGIDFDADNAGALAAASIPTIAALPGDAFKLASVAFLTNHGLWMYIAMGVAAPVALELVGAAALETLAVIVAGIEALFTDAEPAAEQGDTAFYGYDAEGQPVYDPDTPIAFDANQNPVAAPSPTSEAPANTLATGSDAPGSATSAQASAEMMPDSASVPPETGPDASRARVEPVIGSPGETVSLAEALAQPERFHVTRRPRAIYSRAYWGALNPASEEPDTDVPISGGPNRVSADGANDRPDEKEAA